MDKPRGLNGEPIWSAEDVIIGWTSGEPYGYKRNVAVGVSIRMEHIRKEVQTVEHEELFGYPDFSITTHVWNTKRTDWIEGGATVAPLRDLVRYAPTFNRDKARQIAKLDKWHLNAMRAGCVHQPATKDLPKRQGRYGEEIDMDAIPPCPETGYRWGHAWLLRPLPARFLDSVRSLFAGAPDSKIYDMDFDYAGAQHHQLAA